MRMKNRVKKKANKRQIKKKVNKLKPDKHNLQRFDILAFTSYTNFFNSYISIFHIPQK